MYIKFNIITFVILLSINLQSQCNEVSAFRYMDNEQISIASKILDANKLASSPVSLGFTYKDSIFYLFTAIDAYSVMGGNKSVDLKYELVLKNNIKISKVSSRFQSIRQDFQSNRDEFGESLQSFTNTLSLLTGGTTSSNVKNYYITNYLPLTIEEMEQISNSGINDLVVFYDQNFKQNKNFKLKSKFDEESSTIARCMLDAFYGAKIIKNSKFVIPKSPSFTENMNMNEVRDSVNNVVNYFLKGKYKVNKDLFLEFMLVTDEKPIKLAVYNLGIDKKEFKKIVNLIKNISFKIKPAVGIHGNPIGLYFNSYNGFDEIYSYFNQQYSMQ